MKASIETSIDAGIVTAQLVDTPRFIVVLKARGKVGVCAAKITHCRLPGFFVLSITATKEPIGDLDGIT